MKVALLRCCAVLSLLGGSACVSIVPAGAFDYGRGASAMANDTTRVQVGGGGGGAVGTFGVGAAARLERQLNPDVSVGLDVGSGYQTAFSGAASIQVVPTCGYLTAQLNPGRSDVFALRAKVGGGFDTLAQASVKTNLTVPYLAGTLEAVFSPPRPAKDVVLDPYLAVHAGLRASMLGTSLGSTSLIGPAQNQDALTGLLLSVMQANMGVRLGSAVHLSEAVALYASADMDGLLLFNPVVFVAVPGAVLPDIYADLQAGLSVTF
jgi:hypothetical protein